MSAISPAHAVQRPREANFDRVAAVYRWAEYLALGPLLRQVREALLPVLHDCRHALLLGDGDGRFAAKLLRTVPELTVHAVDTSGRMLQMLARRCTRDGTGKRLGATQASALTVQAHENCDLIVSHFMLDCLSQSQVATLAERFAGQVSPGTLWLVSDFEVPARGLLRPWASVYIRLLYLAFRLLTGLRVQRLPDVAEALSHAGWRRVERRERLGGMLYSELWSLVRPETQGQPGINTQLPPVVEHPPKSEYRR